VMLSRPAHAASSAAFRSCRAITALPAVAVSSTPRRNVTLSIWSQPQSHSLVLHSTAQEVPKQWVSPTAERVWHRMKRLKETEFRLWAEEEAAKAKSPWRRWGIYPFVGLGITAMISKEFGILMLGEYQLIPIFIAATSGIYVYGRGGITDFFKTAHQKKRGFDTEVFDWKIELAQEALSEHRSNAQLLDVAREYKAEHLEIRKELANYYAVKPKHDYRAEVIRQLDTIKRQEDEKYSQEQREVLSGSQKFVTDRITKDAALRQQVISDAIDRVLTATKLDTKDPVFKVYNEYLASKGRPALKL